jgi:hypothetical protein
MTVSRHGAVERPHPSSSPRNSDQMQRPVAAASVDTPPVSVLVAVLGPSGSDSWAPARRGRCF